MPNVLSDSDPFSDYSAPSEPTEIAARVSPNADDRYAASDYFSDNALYAPPVNFQPVTSQLDVQPSDQPSDGGWPVQAASPHQAARPARRRQSLRGGVYILIALAVFGAAAIFTAIAFDLHHLMAQSGTAQLGTAQPASSAAALVDSIPSGDSPQAITATPNIVAATTVTPAGTSSATGSTNGSAANSAPSTVIQPWDGKQRFTMLLMGIDKRPGEAGTAFRTDTMIVLSIDPLAHTIGVLSVPRDLFVSFPPDTVIGTNYGLQRINSAYTIGELVKPGSGPEMAMQTVQYNLGIPINAYAVVDFQAVIDLVDAVGGVDIDVPYTINDPAYPNMNFGYDPLYIPKGLVHMDGALALKYARSRHQSSDIDREARQQQIMQAVRDRIVNLNMAPQLIFKAPALWAQLSSDIRTDLTLDQWLQLGMLVKNIPAANIHKAVIGYQQVTPQVWQGADILVPNRTAIAALLPQVFGPDF